ncbi:MAG: hypothetical protein MJZ81_09565 [Bacteroidales bacterium]|nr:hypothetical protein [Bacteroidales bacterium]
MNFNDYLKIRNELSCGRQRTTSFATDGFDKEWSDVLAEKYGEKPWKVLKEDDPESVRIDGFVKKIASEMDGKDQPSTMFVSDAGNHLVVGIAGGMNGPGLWQDYLKTATMLFDAFDTEGRQEGGRSAWLIQIENDCADDVYYLVIGIRKSSRK